MTRSQTENLCGPMDRKLQLNRLYTALCAQQEQGFLFPGESHGMAELLYVEQGQLHSVADGCDLLLQPGELRILGPNQWHMHYADTEAAPRFWSVSFDMEGMELTALLNRKVKASGQTLALLLQIREELDRMDDYSVDMILSQLSLLMLSLLRECGASGKEKPAHIVHGEKEIIRRTQQYISTHVREKLTVPSVARQVDVSPSYLTALFHKNLGIAPGEYIRRVKLQESKRLIRENRLNFTQIAQTLQYSTVHHFSRQFKENFGITPSEYAKQVQTE